MEFELHSASLWLNLVLFAGGFYLLIKGSDLFVDASAAIARRWHVSELVIGLTLVSIGTSLPEFASSWYASFTNQPDFIVGNISGSIVTNITLILGIGVLMAGGMCFDKRLLSRDAVLMNAVFLVTMGMIWGGRAVAPNGSVTYGINRFCGALLLLGAVGYCWWLLRERQSEIVCEHCQPDTPKDPGRSCAVLFLLVLVALGMITFGSKLLVDNVVWGAEKLGVSALLISVTVVAFGTSVPELAVTIAGVRKKCNDLALGNIIGSCIFNVLLIYGICALTRPLAVVGLPGLFNMGMMFGSGVLLLVLMAVRRRLTRICGWILLLGYVGFFLYNLMAC
ncbi:MAG: calcium/sodium antiporter [Victivallaceae bacterium]|nr:calcium/sodium antiporter [Victivallaceae bacterium]